MNSMENFFNWMVKPLPKEDVLIWFNVHNMNYEKIELCGDVFKSLDYIITDTYLGNESESFETKIILTEDDNKSHFDWCWKKLVDDFKRENINIKLNGEHKEYFYNFYQDSFYNQKENAVKSSIPNFLIEVFDVEKPFTKSDLDILTELYKLIDKNLE